MADNSVKKTVPKKTARKTSVRKTATKKNIRKTTAKKTAERKAPTGVARTQATKQRVKVITFVSVGVCVVLTGIGVGVGISADGAINVNSVIDRRLETASDVERREIENVRSRDQRSDAPDGGLVPSTNQEAPTSAPPPVSTSTATSSDNVAVSAGDETATSSNETVTSNETASTSEPEAIDTAE